MSKLEYWSIKCPDKNNKDGFYKFLEPCEHRLYQIGDSWTEELHITRRQFNRAFEKLGVRYKSETAYKEAKAKGDVFQGKFYACYYDRYTNRMFFVRNHATVDLLIKMLVNQAKKIKSKFKSVICSSIEKLTINKPESLTTLEQKSSAAHITHEDERGERIQDAQDNNVINTCYKTQVSNDDANDDKLIDNHKLDLHDHSKAILGITKTLKDKAGWSVGTDHSGQSYINKQLTTISSLEEKIKNEQENKTNKVAISIKSNLSDQMKQIWRELVGSDHIPASNKFKQTLERCLTYLGGTLEGWRGYCQTIASSKFLMGEVSNFKAWIIWAVKPEAIQRIQAKGYSLGDRITHIAKAPPTDYSANIEANIKRQPTAQARQFHQMLANRTKAHEYWYWLKDLEIGTVSGQILQLYAITLFDQTQITNRYGHIIVDIARTIWADQNVRKCQINLLDRNHLKAA